MTIVDDKRARAYNNESAGNPPRRQGTTFSDVTSGLVADGFSRAAQHADNSLGADQDVPPAYSEQHDQLSLHQTGFDAGAAVTGSSLNPP